MNDDIEADAAAGTPDDAELERLRRLAFGRTSSNAEEAAAAAARRELAAHEAAARRATEQRATEQRAAEQRAVRAAAESAAAGSTDAGQRGSSESGAAHPLGDDDDDNDDDLAARPRWRGWVLPALVGLVVGAVVAGGAVWAANPAGNPAALPVAETPAPEPSSTALNYFLGDPPESADLPPGDFAAAERWFAREQTEEDLVGVPDLLPEFDRGSVRLVHSSEVARVWVAKQTDGKLCLETTETLTQITNGTCVVSSNFSERALTVSSNVLTAVWSGAQVSVVVSQR